jgi:ribonuclease HI
VLVDDADNIIWSTSEFLGLGTNNIGEMTAILRGCTYFSEMETTNNLTVYTDSELCVHLISGTKKTKKAHLQKILDRILLVREKSVFEIQWVKAHNNLKWNEYADRLANQAVVNSQQPDALLMSSSSAPAAAPQSAPTYNRTNDDNKIYIKSSFAEKDKVKSLGARWDPARKSWWVADTPENHDKFSKWIPS